MKKIAIIGAGLAGLTVANKLKDFADVTVYEKSRGVSGRMTTRYADPYFFDHGAQFFTVRSQLFQTLVNELIFAKVIERWDPRFIEITNRVISSKRTWDEANPHYVGVPGMNAVAQYLANNLKVQLNTRIVKISYSNQSWKIFDDNNIEQGEYDWLICTSPSDQAVEIIPDYVSFHNYLDQLKMQACFSLMLGFDKAIDLEFDAALVSGDDISWISVNSSKPQRNPLTCLLINSTNQWADEHIDDPKSDVMTYLIAHASEIINIDLATAAHKDIQAWRFANIKKQDGPLFHIDMDNKIACCGDWCIHGRVEAAYLSGNHLASHLIDKDL